jgi:hypothetical protein
LDSQIFIRIVCEGEEALPQNTAPTAALDETESNTQFVISTVDVPPMDMNDVAFERVFINIIDFTKTLMK